MKLGLLLLCAIESVSPPGDRIDSISPECPVFCGTYTQEMVKNIEQISNLGGLVYYCDVRSQWLTDSVALREGM